MKVLFKVFTALFLYNILFCKSCFSQPVVFSDGFNGSSIDMSKWNVTYLGSAGTLEVSGGFCHMQNGTAYPQGPYITSKIGVYPPAKIVFRVKTSLDYSEGSYRTKAGFSGIFFSYSDWIFWGSSYTTVAHNGIVSAWKTDSIIWTSTTLNFYVEGSLAFSTSTGVPVDCEQAYFMIYMDQTGGGSVYDFWVDTVYMEGAECPGAVEEKVEQVLGYGLEVTNPIRNGRGEVSFSIPEDGYVLLRLYDIIGRQVEVLVSQESKKGNHKAKPDCLLRKGIYFASLEYKGTSSLGKRISKKIVIL